jgi:alginate O-acetyltransferase complex protein AlgI
VSFTDKAFFYFLPIFYVVWLATRRQYNAKLGAMLLGSLVFYSFHRWWTLAIILAYCVVDWAAGRSIETARRPIVPLLLGVAFNLGLLCFWKYTPLAVETVVRLFGWHIAIGDVVGAGSWVIPIGISFYSFSGISYMVDVYRKVTPSEPSLLRYSLFTSFFPHLVAGPILRASEFLVHLRPGELPDRPLDMWEGTFLIARGYFKKAVLADSIAVAIDPFFAHVGDASTSGVWALPYVYLYALQIYFDFSGYTDIARGLGLWFGFRWPENFNLPYFATSVQDLATLAHDPVALPARLSLHSAGRKPRRSLARVRQSDDHHAAWRAVAWCQLVICGVGRTAWRVPDRQPDVGRDALARSPRGIVGYGWKILAWRAYPPHLPCRVFRLVLLPAD